MGLAFKTTRLSSMYLDICICHFLCLYLRLEKIAKLHFCYAIFILALLVQNTMHIYIPVVETP